MPTQTYETHRHHPKLTSIGSMFVLVAIVGFALRWFYIGGRYSFAAGLAGLIGANLTLLSISRAFTVRLQDRIIKLEMKVRCATLLTPSQQAALGRLATPQVVALRFASNEELPDLVERAERERLSADQIKRAVKNWTADWDRT